MYVKDWVHAQSLVLRPFSAALPTIMHACKSSIVDPLHRDAFCQFTFRWIYYCYSSKSTGQKTGKTHLCELYEFTMKMFLMAELERLAKGL